MSINISFPSRFCVPTSHSSSITIPLSSSISPAPMFPRTLQELQQSRLRAIHATTAAQRSYHHLAILKHHHNNNDTNNNNKNKKYSFCYTYTRTIYFFSPLQHKWHLMLQFYLQLSSILFFSNLFEQKLFKSSEDYKIWYLLHHRITVVSRLNRTSLCTLLYSQHAKPTTTELSTCSAHCNKISHLSLTRYNTLHSTYCSTDHQRMKSWTYPASHP